MTYPETEFYDCKTLALLYDSDRDVIKKNVHELKDKGHVIEVLYWGKQGKMKVHGKQFRDVYKRQGEAGEAGRSLEVLLGRDAVGKDVYKRQGEGAE